MSYITELNVSSLRNIRPFILTLSSKKNIIFTGRNGSGKTTLLEAIRDEIMRRRKHGADTEIYRKAYLRLRQEQDERTLSDKEREQLNNMARMGGKGDVEVHLQSG